MVAQGWGTALRAHLFATAAAAEAMRTREIERRARSNDREVRASVASRHDLPLPTMLRLGTDRSADVRIALASNRSVVRSAALLDALADDHDVEVRLALLANAAVPDATLQRLTMRKAGTASVTAPMTGLTSVS